VTTHHGLTRALPLKNSNGADAACNPHILGKEHPRRAVPYRDLSAEKFKGFMAVSDYDFGKGAWRR
jgi:hypothetical protein